ncbi:MAG: hypothetical protein WDN03_16615 [Rhizomicrobium sp.]
MKALIASVFALGLLAASATSADAVIIRFGGGHHWHHHWHGGWGWHHRHWHHRW